MKQIIATIILLLTLVSTSLHSQEVSLIGKQTENGIKLRVIPDNGVSMAYFAAKGFDIERRELGADVEFTVVNESPLLTKAKPEWLKKEEGEYLYDFHKNTISGIQKLAQNEGPINAINNNEYIQEAYGYYFLLTTRIPGFADLAGYVFEDLSVEQNKSYEYRAVSKGSQIKSKSYIIDYTGQIKQTTDLIIKQQDKSIFIEWIHEQDQFEIAYNIQKSLDGKSFTTLNSAPIFYNSSLASKDSTGLHKENYINYVDSLESNYTDVYYRLIAVDVWVENSAPSEIVKTFGVDKTPPELPKNITITNSQNNELLISWDKVPENDLAGIFIAHSPSMNGPYELIHEDLLNKNTQNYIYDVTNQSENYFQIGVIDTSGNINYSLPKYGYVIDKTAPSTPKELIGEVDSLGTVTLYWQESFDTNLNGYYVFHSYSREGNYIKLNPIKILENTFVDSNSLELLNTQMFYKIQAVDKNFNQSEFSEILEIALPDTIAPSFCHIDTIIQTSNGLKLFWDKHVSEDLSHFEIEFSNEDLQFINQKVIDKSLLSFEDTLSQRGTYSYRLRAIDTSGNIGKWSNSYNHHFSIAENNSFNLIKNINGQTINISWPDNGQSYKVYLGEDESSMKLSKVINLNSINLPITDKEKRIYVVAKDSKGKKVASSRILEL